MLLVRTKFAAGVFTVTERESRRFVVRPSFTQRTERTQKSSFQKQGTVGEIYLKNGPSVTGNITSGNRMFTVNSHYNFIEDPTNEC